jgi:hypothetical protein
MAFAIDRHTCALLTLSPCHASQAVPIASIETCGIDFPLRVYHINGTYSLFSEVIEHYSEASKLMNELKTRSPELDMWVRPIQRSPPSQAFQPLNNLSPELRVERHRERLFIEEGLLIKNIFGNLTKGWVLPKVLQ